MDQFSKTIQKKVSAIQDRFQQLLELEEVRNEEIHKQTLNQPFEICYDTEYVNGLSVALPESTEDKMIFIFSRLTQFFDAGIFIHKKDSAWGAQAMFINGKLFNCSAKTKKQRIKIPITSVEDVLSVSTQNLLRKLSLEYLDPDQRLTALIIRPTEDYGYVLLSRLPDLWLKDHSEKVLNSILKGLAS